MNPHLDHARQKLDVKFVKALAKGMYRSLLTHFLENNLLYIYAYEIKPILHYIVKEANVSEYTNKIAEHGVIVTKYRCRETMKLEIIIKSVIQCL